MSTSITVNTATAPNNNSYTQYRSTSLNGDWLGWQDSNKFMRESIT